MRQKTTLNELKIMIVQWKKWQNLNGENILITKLTILLENIYEDVGLNN